MSLSPTKVLVIAAGFALYAAQANAQSANAQVVGACGTPASTYVAGTVRPLTVDTTGTLCSPGGGGTSTNVKISATNGDALTDTANALDINVKSSSISNQSVNTAQVNGVTTSTGAGAVGTGSQRVAVGVDATTMGGSPIPATAYQANVTSTKAAANASPTILRSYMLYNGNTSVCYLQFFNLALANVTVGSTAPTFFVAVPANGGANFALVFNFSIAMSVAATTTATGSTNCTNGMDVSLIQN